MSIPMLTQRSVEPSTPSTSASVQRPLRAAGPWVHGPLADTLLGWCWLPVALVMHGLEASITRTQALMGVIFLVSFAHQPLTLGLVYGALMVVEIKLLVTYVRGGVAAAMPALDESHDPTDDDDDTKRDVLAFAY